MASNTTHPKNRKPTKVLHILANVTPGGTETLLLNLVREQHRSGQCENVVAVIEMANDAGSLRSHIEQVAKFRDLDCNSFFSLDFVRKFRALLKSENPDVVQCWSHDSGVVAGAIAKYMFNIKVTWAIHSLDLPSRGEYTKIRFNTLKAMVGSASRLVPDQIISCSDAATSAHLEFGYPLVKCKTIDNGIDMHRYRINPEARKLVRNALNIPTESIVVGYIGRSHPVKRIEDYFAATAILMEQRSDLHFVALGLPLEDLYAKARAAYDLLPDPSRMHLLGRCSNPENYIPAMDVTMLTSESEALPMVLMESLACGVPCVSTDVGSASRVIGSFGKCVPAKDPECMAKAVIEVLGKRYSPTQARQYCREKYSISSTEKKYSECYQNLIAPKTSAKDEDEFIQPHVIHLVNDVGYGGAQVLLKRLSIGLKKNDFQQSVVSVLPLEKIGKLAPEFEKAGIPVVSLDINGPISGIAGLFKFAAMIREKKPDLIQTWMFHSALIGEIAAFLSFRKTRTLWSIHHTVLGKESSKFTTRVIHRILAWISPVLPEKIIYCSKAGLDLHHESGFDTDRSELIFNGTDTQAYQPNPAAKVKLRNELGIPADAPLIGMAGRYHPQKDFANLLRAFALVQKVIPDAHLLACGPEVTRETTALRDLADACPSPEQVHLIGPRRDMVNIYPALTLGTLSSCEGEAFPLVLGETMSCEVPCVATDVGDSALIIGDTGRIVAPRDSHALAAEIILLLKLSPDAFSRLGKRARERVQKKFALDTYVNAHASLYRKLLEIKPRSKKKPVTVKRKTSIPQVEAPAA